MWLFIVYDHILGCIDFIDLQTFSIQPMRYIVALFLDSELKRLCYVYAFRGLMGGVNDCIAVLLIISWKHCDILSRFMYMLYIHYGWSKFPCLERLGLHV